MTGSAKGSKIQKALGLRTHTPPSRHHAKDSNTQPSHDVNHANDVDVHDDEAYEVDEIPRDLELAIHALKTQIQVATGLLLPQIVLKNHLRRNAGGGNGLMGDDGALTMERDLDEMRRLNRVRLFRVNLPPTFNEEALMTIDDYREALTTRATQSHLHTKVVEAFMSKILPRHTSVSIASSELVDDLKVSTLPDGIDPEASISILMQLGALSRQPGDHHDTRYMFSVPSLGPLLKFIIKGREEVLGILSSRQYKEMSVDELLKVKLKRSKLSISWHLRDLVSLGNGVVRSRGPHGKIMIKIIGEGSGRGRKRKTINS